MIVSTNEGNPNALKLVIATKLAQETVSIRILKPSNATLGRLPTLTTSTGLSLFSISSALRFLLSVPKEVEVFNDRWLEWEISQLQPAILSHTSAKTCKTLQKSYLWSLLKDLNNELRDKQYLIEKCSNLSPADISIWVSLWSTILITDIANDIAKDLPSVNSWLANIQKQPIIQQSIKESIEMFKLERGSKAIASIEAASWFPINTASNPQVHESVPSDISPTKEKEMDIVNQEELCNMAKSWTTEQYPEVKESSYPILPKKDERNMLITSALPYVNNVPHLGNIIGCVLSADIFARYCRQRNYNTLYICGTDEYGTATEAKALQEKTTPQAICDKFFDIHNDVYRWFGIGFDYFGRTSTPEQTEIVQGFFLNIKSQGYVLTETVEQLHCESCDRFLADRFVEGTCPGCKYEDARGDQCDGCGHLVNAVELINPRCKICNTKPVVKNSIQFFLDLPKLEEKLKEYSTTRDKGWSNIARVVSKAWLRDGLQPRCITRDLKWGIPVPVEGFENKVFYVWFDAPFGYISITKRYTKEYKQWWQPSAQDIKIDLYQFMAKDNIPFHTIMFPACLLAANQNYTLMKCILATEYLNYEDKKFSKSRGIGVFGTDARDTGIPADVWRFYLAYIRPETQDSNFNWVDLATKNNSELLNNLGNFVNRALVFSEKFFNSNIPPIEPEEADWTVLALAQRELSAYINAMEQGKLKDGLKRILAISKHGNQYMQFQQPWVKIKGNDNDKKKAGTVVAICCNLACLLSALLAPFMPSTAKQLRSQLGLNNKSYGYIPEIITNMLPTWHKIGKPSPLFTKIEDQKVEMLRKKYAGQQETNGDGTNKSSDESIAILEAAITKQGNLVRELKAKNDKSIWQPQVEILLDLKKKLTDLKSNANAPAKKSPAKNKKAEPMHVPEQNGNALTDVAALESAIAKQGNLVRELKTKEDGSVWKPQVEILLKLKQRLSDLTGTTPVVVDKKSKKKK
ncbi:PREDICTED: methionine--tRNA ligase, cytoplasmic isoform X1 [Trachymyrmex septentrionalis]|uniref:methionine--tRNA ligase, cytoplasmic isoform X1 n=1 Tax=Trachymyrmex septentrionalis TaxID=34720 RepID=UPI00084F0470|nr:PREDICTED: methionine--tRNA ligase, cytoplasmic isoform X1 [Trachymyrmex septentrionalis]